MSASSQAPPVLARRGNQPTRGKASDSGASRPGKDKSSGEKASEATKSETAKPARTRTQNEGEKLVLRRLPPGMTQAEVSSILGPEWDLGKGKVDWLSFSQGKISKDPAKPSRPGRMNLHLVRKDDIMALCDVVRSATWEDAKGTFTSTSLIGPPVVEFATYKKIPSSRKRTDARQGTIDQDPEFMAFLEGLANPTAPKEGGETEDSEDAETDAKITSTPLVEYLKEKRANKAKESSGKGPKASGAAKGKGGAKDDESTKKKGRGAKDEKADKSAPKETVKILTKKAATEQAAEAAKNVASQIAATSGGSSAADAPKSRRAGIAAAARLLQRDLGLSPGSAHRRARQDAAKADSDIKPGAATEATPSAAPAAAVGGAAAVATERPSSPAPSDGGSQNAKTAASKSSRQRNRGGRGSDKVKAAGGSADTASPQTPTAANPPILLKKGEPEPSSPVTATSIKDVPEAEATAASQAKSTPKSTGKQGGQGNQKKQTQSSPSVTAGATRAFVKHASASQGVTEALLRQTLSATFGEVTAVEHDKRKGFAYVDFAQHDSLARAIAAGPVSVGQASVQILERKEKKPAAAAAATSPSGAASPTQAQQQQRSSTSPPASGVGVSDNAQKDKPASSGRSRRGRGRGGGGATGGNKSAGGEKRQAGQAAPSANGGGSGSGAG